MACRCAGLPGPHLAPGIIALTGTVAPASTSREENGQGKNLWHLDVAQGTRDPFFKILREISPRVFSSWKPVQLRRPRLREAAARRDRSRGKSVRRHDPHPVKFSTPARISQNLRPIGTDLS